MPSIFLASSPGAKQCYVSDVGKFPIILVITLISNSLAVVPVDFKQVQFFLRL